MWTRIALACAACWLAVTTAAAAEAVRVIELKQRPAAEILPLIQPLLGPGEAASATDYRLLLRVSDARLREIEGIVAQLDAAARGLLITVWQVPEADAQRRLRQLSLQAGTNGARVTTTAPAVPVPGPSVRRSDADGSARYRTQRGETDLAEERMQVLRTQEGGHAYVRIGQSVPYIESIIRLSGERLRDVRAATLQDVTAGFDVVARVRGEEAVLAITPKLHSLANPDIDRARLTDVATNATVKLGAWSDLGSVLRQASAVSNTVLDSAAVGTGERYTLLIKLELADAAPRAAP